MRLWADRTVAKLTNNSGLQVNKHCPGNVFPGASLTEERIEGIISTTDSFITGHLAIWLNTVFKAIQLPAGIAHLNTGLASMDWDAFTLKKKSKIQLYKPNLSDYKQKSQH